MFSVIFEVHPGEGRKERYLDYAKELKPLLESVDGFVDNERFECRTRPGWILSHSTWRDEKSVVRWRTVSRHHAVQQAGREEVFDGYHLRVGEVVADSVPTPKAPVREMRLDETEVAEAKYATFTEVEPAQGTPGGADQDVPVADRFIPADGAAGKPLGLDVFASIYNPGKLAVLAAWRDRATASAFEPVAPPEFTIARNRVVRVVRDYGMEDRRESPQYYPAVRSAG